MGPEKEFEKNVRQLMQLLKKMMMQYPSLAANEEISKMMKNPKDVPDVNIFLLNLAPLSPEEFEELDEIFEESILSESHRSGELKYELNGEDLEFLKKNGLRF